MNINDIVVILKLRPDLKSFMPDLIELTSEELQMFSGLLKGLKNETIDKSIQLLEILMNCTPETIEKGIQILEMMKNPKYAELIDNILQIEDSRRLNALLCWSNQYRGEKEHGV